MAALNASRGSRAKGELEKPRRKRANRLRSMRVRLDARHGGHDRSGLGKPRCKWANLTSLKRVRIGRLTYTKMATRDMIVMVRELN